MTYRISYIVGTYPPAQVGGAANVVYWLAKAMAKEGHAADVMTTSTGLEKYKDLKLDEWQDREGVQVIYTQNKSHLLPLKLLREALRKNKFADIIHLNGLSYPVCFLLGMWAVLTGKKLLWSVHGELAEASMKRANWIKKIELAFIKRLNKKSVLFHATSVEEVAQIQEKLGTDKEIIRIPVYMDLPTQVQVEKEDYFAYIGRIDPIKGIDNLIKALSKSKTFRASNYKLKIAGGNDSAYGRELEHLVGKEKLLDKIEFLGHTAGDDKQMFLGKAKWLFMPSHTENFGIVAIEALAQQTPVVASTATPWQILNETGAGYWESNSIDDLAIIIDQLLSMDENQYDKFKDNANHLAQDQYNIDNNIQYWIKAYQRLYSK